MRVKNHYTNGDTGQETIVTIDTEPTVTGKTIIEVLGLDENGDQYRLGWRTFPDAPVSMSDLDLMCQQVDGYQPIN